MIMMMMMMMMMLIRYIMYHVSETIDNTLINCITRYEHDNRIITVISEIYRDYYACR